MPIKESAFQAKIIKWLKSQGCYVIKNTGMPGVPVGCPDVVFFKEGFYGFIEVKPSKDAGFQPLQKPTLEKLDAWSWAKVVHPQNWDEIKLDLERML